MLHLPDIEDRIAAYAGARKESFAILSTFRPPPVVGVTVSIGDGDEVDSSYVGGIDAKVPNVELGAIPSSDDSPPGSSISA